MTGSIRKRETKNGITWQVVLEKGVDSNGKRIREYITVNGTKKEAQAILNEKLADFQKGTYIEPSKVTVASSIAEWLKVYAEPRLALSTVRGYRVNFDKHTIPYIGHIPIQQLTPMQVQDMYIALDKKGLSPRSIKYVHTTLHSVLEYNYKMRRIPHNVCKFVSTPKQRKYKNNVYNQQEVQQLLKCSFGTDLEIPIHLLVGLGLRRGELLALRWQDFDVEKKTVSINRNLVCIGKEFHFDKPKTESGIRTISIPDHLIPMLKAHRVKQNEIRLLLGGSYHNGELVVCHDDGTPYHTGSFSHKFKRFLDRHDLPRIRLHDLRHTNATLMMMFGVPAKVAAQRLGHADVSITLDIYSHVLNEMQEEAADKLNNGIFGNLDKEVKTS